MYKAGVRTYGIEHMSIKKPAPHVVCVFGATGDVKVEEKLPQILRAPTCVTMSITYNGHSTNPPAMLRGIGSPSS